MDQITYAKSIIGILFGLSSIYSAFYAVFLFIIGGMYLRSFLILLLCYQYFYAKKNSLIKKLMLWLNAANYFEKVQFQYEEEINENDDKSMFPCHPHGLFCFSVFLHHPNNNGIFSKSKLLMARPAYYLPFGGLIHSLYGSSTVNPQSFNKLLKDKTNVCFYPGGFEEATLTKCEENTVYINNRKGFIKYALKYGYTIYPTYFFDECNLWKTFSLGKFGLLLNKLKIPAIFPKTLLPNKNCFLKGVVGKGIKLPKIENPTKEDIGNYHEIYIEKLKELFEKHKINDEKLIIY